MPIEQMTVEASKLGASDNCYRVWTTGRFLGRAPLWITVALPDVGNVFKLSIMQLAS